MDDNVCCFLGHRKITVTEALKLKLSLVVKKLIEEEQVKIFLFGSKSQFCDFCYEIVSEMKINYPHIKRIYVRAEFPYIDVMYKKYLLRKYEDTFYPEKAVGAGKAVYIKRNYEMIDLSKFCIMYYNTGYENNEQKSKSGTDIAYKYAVRKGKIIINTFDF